MAEKLQGLRSIVGGYRMDGGSMLRIVQEVEKPRTHM